jgi:ATP-binding cassette, subfamily F, member 3
MRLDRQRQEWESQQEFVAKTEEFIRRNLAGQRTKEAQGRRTRLERFLRDEALDRPQDQQQIRLGLTTQIRSGDLVLATKDLGRLRPAALLRPKIRRSAVATAWR